MSLSSSQGRATPAELSSKRSSRKELIDHSLYPPFLKQMDAKLPGYIREGDIEYPFEETNGVGDENRIRGNWSTKTDYILAAVGFTFGIGNLWRFPFLIFQHGGVAFFIPYLIVLVIAALPMFFMEIVLGQFSSLAAISVWNVVPLFKGVGVAMVLISCIIAIYLNIVSAWSLFYFINSISFSLPWSNCENSWSGLNCSLGTRISCTEANGTLLLNGSCVIQNANTTVVISGTNPQSIPSLRYFHEDVLMLSTGFTDIGTLNWYLGICVLLSWVAVFLCLFQGVKSSGKVVYVVVVLPFIIMTVLLARLLTLEGSFAALAHFLYPDWRALKNLTVWGEAAVHAFYSVACCTGGLYTTSSYNRFHNNLFKDLWVILTVDVITSVICCVLTFSAIGFTCFEFSISLEKFHIRDGAHLVFVFLAEALAGVPVAPLYTGLFFLMVVLIIHSTQLFVVETIVTSLCDEFPERLRRNRRHVLTTVCAAFMVLSIPFCLSSGLFWLLLLAKFTITWPLVVIAFLECMAISWVYGVDNLLDNIKWMTGSYPPCYIFWKILWKFICPMTYLSILCFLWLDWHSISYESYIFPYWTSLLGWAISVFPLLFVPIVAVIQICTARGSLSQKWASVLNPDDSWGPALAVHRAEQFPLQIPEARRLLISPEVEVVGSRTGLTEEKDGILPEAQRDEGRTMSTGVSGRPRSAAPTINSLCATFERETAI
uniref:Sodium:neurotransmitter symporter domain containing protein n=1 Tax=Haemonchus contortus TaxID=6289 RepID=W6NFM8_HAECO